MIRKIGLLIILLSFCVSCARVPDRPTPAVEALPASATPAMTPQSSPTPEYTATPVAEMSIYPQNVPQYFIEATLDYDNHILQVRETVEYRNQSNEAIKELTFVVHASRFAYVFQYQGAYLNKDQRLYNEMQKDGYLVLPLLDPLNSGDLITITLEFTLALPEREGTLGYTNRQTNLANFFPVIPPYNAGQGWLVHEPGGFGEYMVYEAANFDVRLKLIGDNLVAAASASPTRDGEWLHYQLKGARNFAISVSPYFRVREEVAGDTHITSYWFTDYDAAGEAALQTTVQAFILFKELFGELPRESISVVESDFLHGMEYDGLFFLSRGFYENYTENAQSNLVIIAAHETSHQWFYSLVANDQALEPWLDESLATYCELLFYEKYHPDLVNWWWDNRIRFFGPSGWIDGNIYDPEGYESYRNAVYLNGAQFFNDLRITMGDQLFFAFLKDYTTSNLFQIANKEDFFEAAKRYTQADLKQLTAQYFENPIP